MSVAFINPSLFRWARERAQLPVHDVARKLGTRVEKILAWEEGVLQPTFRQAQNFAHHVHVPFGYLFLPVPPVETLPIPDLRTVGDQGCRPASPEFKDLMNDVLRKWEWFRDYLNQENPNPLPFVGKYGNNAKPSDVANDIQATIGIDDELRNSVASWEEFLRVIIDRADSKGVWVLRSGIVGNNTHRPLDVDEFRGFAISDTHAPLIFLNGRDAKAAQIFTIAHELAHIWVGESGISNLSLTSDRSTINRIEKFCNDVATEVLVPKKLFMSEWNNALPLRENCERLCRRFRVSTVVIARRALDARAISLDQFWQFYNTERAHWTKAREEGSPGGDFYRTLKVRNGNRYSRAVLASAFRGKLLYRDAASLLGTSTGNLDRFAKELHVR